MKNKVLQEIVESAQQQAEPHTECKNCVRFDFRAVIAADRAKRGV